MELKSNPFQWSSEKTTTANQLGFSQQSGAVRQSNSWNMAGNNLFKMESKPNEFQQTKPENSNPFGFSQQPWPTAATNTPAKVFNFNPFSLSKDTKNINSAVNSKSDSIDEILAVPNQTSSPIKKNPTTLIAIDVPAKFLDKAILMTHFEKFGKVNKLLINQKSSQALIYFSDHSSAFNAKNKGKKLHPILPEMKLLFRAPPQTDLESHAVLPSTIKDTPAMSKPELKVNDTPIQQVFQSSSKKVDAMPSSSNNSASLLKSQTSGMERYTMLDVRDKLIRNQQSKVLDVNQAEYLLASCPDMCPEKERYLRYVQNDLSSFEMSDGKLDHKYVVKQFSRSSADKEEPLPHELRPGRVLKKTMDFLVCNIVEKFNDRNVLSDVWYNFMLNRTRAIRNDLMQQHLVDHNAMYVLERCIRFHIHCSHEFCENSLDMDAKINDEHLSKSLQSLRELYYDMSEMNEFSVAEPEFRCYELLLNLSRGDIFFRYQKFTDSVRSSQPVQFAVKVLHAFHSNNYVKFYKLVQSSSYLQGCILHKYYKSMRMNTMKIVVKGYTLSRKTQVLTIDHMKRVFGMCEEAELKEFVESYGLLLSADGTSIKINRAKIISPESYTVRKDAYILKKKKCIIAEVINGGALPQNPLANYIPHDSFTETGVLTKNAQSAVDQVPVEQHPVLSSPVKSDDDLQKRLLIRTKIFYEMILMRRCFNNWLRYLKDARLVRELRELRAFKLSKKYYGKWHCAVLRAAQIKEVADIFYLKKVFKKWQAHVEHAKELRRYQMEATNLGKRILTLKYLKIWKIAVYGLRRKRRMAAVRKLFLCRKYIMIWQSIVITSRVMKDANVYYENKLLVRLFSDWRSWIVARQLERKELHKHYPAVASSMPVVEQNEKWSWGYKRGKSENLSVLDVTKLWSTITRSLNRSETIDQDGFFDCLPFSLRFQEHLDTPLFTPNIFNIFIKLYIYISPDLNQTFVKWIRAKFNLSEKKNMSKINENIIIHSQRAKHQLLVVIVETEDIFSDFETFSQVIAFCSIREIQALQQTIASSNLSNKLLICESSRVDLHSTVWQLSVRSLVSKEISNRLCEKVFNMWKNTVENSNIRMGNCSCVFNESFSTTILNPVQKIIDQRISFGNYKMPPSILLSMFNEFVDHFSSCVKNDLRSIIPQEVLNGSYCSTVSDINFSSAIKSLKSLILPPLLIGNYIPWKQLETELSAYCSRLCNGWNDDLKSEIFFILQTVKENVLLDNDVVDVYSIPWMDIIFRLITYNVSSMDECVIIYDADLLANFCPTEDYLSYLKIYTAPTNVKSQSKHNSEHQSQTKKRKKEIDTDRNIVRTKKLKSSLLQDMAEENAKLQELESKIQNEIDLVNKNITNYNQKLI